MHVPIDSVLSRLETAAARVVSASEAAHFADLVVETHLRKAPRMNPLQEAVDDLKVWMGAERREVTAVVDKGSVLLLDFGGLAPSLKLGYVHDELERRAHANGVAVVGLRNSSGIITLDPWSLGLAARGLIGIALFDGGTGCTVPYGGTRGVFGTLPLAYAIPTAEDPLVLDMAMTEIPYFQIKEANENGSPLPVGAAVDCHGLPTTEPSAALGDDGVANLLPLGGGFKGYGLAVLLEVLTGAFVGSLLSTDQTPGWNPPEYGGLVIAFDIAAFTDPDRFKREVSEMCRQLRRHVPADWADAVAVPGDRGGRKAADARATGTVDMTDEFLAELEELARQD